MRSQIQLKKNCVVLVSNETQCHFSLITLCWTSQNIGAQKCVLRTQKALANTGALMRYSNPDIRTLSFIRATFDIYVNTRRRRVLKIEELIKFTIEIYTLHEH